MHFSSRAFLLALLPGLVVANTDNNDQVPLKEKAAGWFDKAKAYVSSAVPSIPSPIDAGAKKVVEYKVEKINIRNYERKLGPKPDGEEEWMIFITGGNKTCHGRCDHVNLIWNESVPLLAALEPFSGSTLKFGQLNCEVEEVLCTAWAAAVPSIFHFIFPQQVGGMAHQSQAPSPMHDVFLNMTGATVEDIVSIPRASEARYLSVPEYTGAFHPVDGFLRKFSLMNPVGYLLWGFGTTPSWLFMIAISFFSRQVMARRAANRGRIDPTFVPRPAAGAGADAPADANAAAAAPRAAGVSSGNNPSSPRSGGAKKRR